MSTFSPPGFVKDLPPIALQKWSNEVEAFFASAKANHPNLFSPFDLPAGQSGTQKLIPWNGFPKKYVSIANADPMFRYKAVEEPVKHDLEGRNYSSVYSTNDGAQFPAGGIKNFLFRDQDEYLEWKSFRDASGKLQKIVFTCDHPEYWKFIAEFDPNLLLSLYQKYVSPNVKLEDLLFNTDVFELVADNTILNRKGKYNPFNKWNTTDGIMHLSHPANYLSAEIQLAADATILRKKNGQLLTDADQLIQCAQYGNAARSSDPKIGSDVNTLVRAGFSVSIKDPVALYIHDVNEASFEFPNGLSLKDFMHVVRGDAAKSMMLRIEFTAPAGVSLEQIKVNGKPLQFGGQIADTITMAIFGLGFHFPGNGTPITKGCGELRAAIFSIQNHQAKHR